LDNSTTPLLAAGSPSVISNSAPAGDMPAERSAGHSKAETKVDMEPLVFSGRAQAKAHPAAPPAPTLQAAALPLSIKAADPLPAVVVLPPSEPKRTNKGFFGRVKGLFGSIFH
jgi:hypothetical protein